MVFPKYTQLLLNNEWVDSSDKRDFETIDPSNEQPICRVQWASSADVDKAVEYAEKAFNGPWRKMAASQRGKLINRLADLMEQNIDELAELESLDNGKPVSVAKSIDMTLSISVFRYYAGWCDKITGKVIPIDGPFLCYTRKEPVGICGQIIPWNFPVAMIAWKWGPLLATGCVSILKPAEQTPLTALRVGQLAIEAGFPPGVLQILPGMADTGKAIVTHPKIDKIAFTGSTEVGYHIMRNAPSHNIKRVSLELGGKSANIICEDADLDLAVQQSQLALFFNQGQCCIAGSRLYVHEKIYDKFVEKSIEAAKKIKVGDPKDNSTEQGPQADKQQFNKILRYIESGKKEGADLLLGGERHGNLGYYIQPTVFGNVKENMTIGQEEIFGPVMCILKYSSYDEVIERANNTNYGLGCGIVTNNIELYQKIANSIRVGTVYVNCYNVIRPNNPFGGFKDSGLGRELGEEGLDAYQENKTIIIKRGEDCLP